MEFCAQCTDSQNQGFGGNRETAVVTKNAVLQKSTGFGPKKFETHHFLKFCILAVFLAHYSKFEYTNTK